MLPTILQFVKRGVLALALVRFLFRLSGARGSQLNTDCLVLAPTRCSGADVDIVEPIVGAPCAEVLHEHIGSPFFWSATLGGSPQCCCVACTMNHTVCLPHANVVGFPKAGSTALHGALLLHPAIREGFSKELALHWEALEPGASPSARKRLIANILRPRRPGSTLPRPDSILLNSDPAAHEGDRLRLLSRLVPNARILFILRDPAERVLSALLHLHRSSTSRQRESGLHSQPRPSDLLALVDKLIADTVAVGGALCTAKNVPFHDAFPALLNAALAADPAHLPPCLNDRVVRCGDPRAGDPDSAIAIWPLHGPAPPQGMAFYLSPILEAIRRFGPTRVDVRWLESFRADPAAHIQNVSRFFGLYHIARPPRDERELAEAMRRSGGSVAQLMRTSWSSTIKDSSRVESGPLHGSPETTSALARLKYFFAPYERAFSAWASATNCATLLLPP